MKVDDLDIKEITFGQERELYSAYKKAYRNTDIDFVSGNVSNIKIDWEAHDMAIAMALDFAIEKPEEVLQDMSHPEIDTLGQKILLKYLRMDNESKKI